MKKQNANNELAFSSPFTLQNCASRLRSLSRRRKWMFTIRPLGDDTYYFTMSGKHHSATVGYLYRQASTTLVTIQQERNWLLFALSVLGVLAFALIDLRTLSEVYRSISQSSLTYMMSAVNFFPIAMVLSVEFFITFQLARTARGIFKGAANIAHELESSLTDAIPDLPQSQTFADEDGELMIIDDYDTEMYRSQRNG
jgi:hypothetical protein